MKEYISRSPDETKEIASQFAKTLNGGEIIAFLGGMGSGKTTFISGIVKALEAGEAALSPTFTLMNEYSGRIPIKHFDMYRVDTWEDVESTGFFDYIGLNNVILIEWSENIYGVLPDNTVFIDMSIGKKETERVIRIDVDMGKGA